MRRDPVLSSSPLRSSGGRVWTFQLWRVDEANRLLSHGTVIRELEAKPFDLLLELLRHAGEVVTKDELLDAVWPGVTVVEGSLTTAISKLRKVLGDSDNTLIVTVPRIGYRFTETVGIEAGKAKSPVLTIEPGSQVPGRPNWRYDVLIGQSPHADVWRIVHEKTHAVHVLKMAVDADGLRALKREVAVSRLFSQSLGDRPDFVPVIDWNFSETPFFIESVFSGQNLNEWAVSQGGLTAIPLPLRIDLMARIATTLSAAHGVGVLHKDLKPENILVSVDRNGHWQPKVVDFGSAYLLQPDRLGQLGITHTSSSDENESLMGTTPWLAPELFAGHAPSLSSDIYALGVLLYQFACGDLRRPLATGWEQNIDDPMLRADIAAATAGDPAQRLDSAAELARRLNDIETRRNEARTGQEASAQAKKAEEKLHRIRMRRPWVVAAGIALVIGVGVSSVMALQAARERDNALRQTRIADAVNGFLANDLLARSNPFRSATATESFIDAVKQAAPLIDHRFEAEPAVAARLHQTLANAFDKRSSWPEARAEYDRAQALWIQAGAGGTADAAITHLQHAMMEARAYQDNSLDTAKSELAAAETLIKASAIDRPDVAVWLASAKGMVALVGNDAKEAKTQFTIASDAAARLPQFEPSARLTFRQRLAFTKIRLGDAAGAEADFRALKQDYGRIEGSDGPNVLQSQMNLIQALMIGGKHAAAVAEANSLYPQMARRLGADHEMTLQLLMTRAQSEGMLERFKDAIRDDLQANALATKKLGPRSFFAVASLTDAATAQCRSGRGAEGLKNVTKAYRDSLAGFGKVALTDAAHFTMAECEIDLGHYAQAGAYLDTINVDEVAQLAGDPNWGANVQLEKARIALAQNHKAEARKYLESVRPVYSAAGVDPYQARLWRSLYSKTDKSNSIGEA